MHQFWSKGYQYTSIHDLLAAMNLSKSSLYQAFGSMRQLFRQCVGRYADQFAAQLRHGLAEARRDGASLRISCIRCCETWQGHRAAAW